MPVLRAALSVARLFALAAVLVAVVAKPAWAGAPPEYVPDEILVRYRERPPEGMRAAAGRLMPSVCRVRLPAAESVPEALERLAGDPGVAWAEPNYVIRAEETGSEPAWLEEVWPSDWAQDEPGLWALRELEAPRAWELATGSPEVIVAVVDSGVCLEHPELSPNLYRNPAEVLDGRDDDGNGYVDDVCGWDFLEDDNYPADSGGHGSFIAGLIGAVGDNGEGALGVNWRVSILALRVMDEAGRGDVGRAVEAIAYGLEAGARVINLSWKASGRSQALEDILSAAERAGAIVVCSAGNEAANTDIYPHYPSGFELENIVSVAASGPDGALLATSNFGPASVDVAAPGQALLSTTADGGYGLGSGTSFAAALVSGVAALILSYDGYRELPLLELRSRLLDAADRLRPLAGLLTTGGRVNAGSALCCLAPLRAVVRVGEALSFHLPRGCEHYEWSLSDPGLGTIEAGRFQAGRVGQCRVQAVPLEGGEALSTDLIEVVGTEAELGQQTPPTAASDEGGGGGGCFIATAAWGSPQAPEVLALRRLRDRCLLKTAIGRAFVGLYYSHSPPLARFVAQRAGLRPLLRLALAPLAWLARPAADLGGGWAAPGPGASGLGRPD